MLPTRQARIAAIAVRLSDLKHGEIATYDALRDEFSIDIRQMSDYSIFHEAQAIARDDHGVVLRCVRKIGYVRLTDEEVANDTSRISKIRRQAKCALKETFAVDPAQLTPEAQCKAAVKSVLLSDMISRTSASAIKKEVRIVMGSSDGMAELLSAMKESHGGRAANDGKTRDVAEASANGAKALIAAFAAAK